MIKAERVGCLISSRHSLAVAIGDLKGGPEKLARSKLSALESFLWSKFEEGAQLPPMSWHTAKEEADNGQQGASKKKRATSQADKSDRGGKTIKRNRQGAKEVISKVEDDGLDAGADMMLQINGLALLYGKRPDTVRYEDVLSFEREYPQLKPLLCASVLLTSVRKNAQASKERNHCDEIEVQACRKVLDAITQQTHWIMSAAKKHSESVDKNMKIVSERIRTMSAKAYGDAQSPGGKAAKFVEGIDGDEEDQEEEEVEEHMSPSDDVTEEQRREGAHYAESEESSSDEVALNQQEDKIERLQEASEEKSGEDAQKEKSVTEADRLSSGEGHAEDTPAVHPRFFRNQIKIYRLPEQPLGYRGWSNTSG